MAEKRGFLPLTGVLAVWLAVGMVPPAMAQVSFAPAVNYRGHAGHPVKVAVADVNNDGKLDIVAVNFDIPILSLLLGNGNGTFSSTTGIFIPLQAFSVAVGDFNKDGNLDLAGSNWGFEPSFVSVMLGTGTGTYTSGTVFPVGSVPRGIAAGEFNNDGKLDLVTANEGSNNVSVLLGNGNGTFGAATNFPVGSFPQEVAVSDVNGDGKLDLVIANQNSNNVSILLGDGNGNFGAATSLPVGLGPTSVAAADFNGDGKPDLAAANSGSNTVTVLLGNGNGTFSPATNFPVGMNPQSVAVGDFDGDGKPDLVTANQNSNTVSVLLGNGNGNFGAAINFPVGLIPRGVAVGDLNGDGKPDIVTANQEGSVSVLLNGDAAAPVISCGSANGLWHSADVSILCTAQDADSGLANPADANFLLTTNVPSGTETSNAATGTRTVCDTKGNCATAGPIAGNKVDKKAPSVSCGSADDQWHSANLSVGCIASDGGSGVAPSADANFLLQTNVAPGAESASAGGVPRNVCDAVSNCTAASVPGGIKVDRKAPTITIISPTATRYLPRQAVPASYSCADGGSGVALCVGPVPSGSNIDTAPPAGPKTFTVFAADKTGNVSSRTVTYEIGTPGP